MFRMEFNKVQKHLFRLTEQHPSLPSFVNVQFSGWVVLQQPFENVFFVVWMHSEQTECKKKNHISCLINVVYY